MADDENQTTTETVTTEAPASQPSTTAPTADTKVFTQDEVNRLMAKTREETRQRVLKESRPVQQIAPTPQAVAEEPNEKLSMKELKAQLDETNRRLRFADMVASYQIDPALKSDFYDLCKVQNPSMDPGWFETKAKLFTKQTPPPATQTPTTPNPAASVQPSTAPPASDKGSPAPGGTVQWEAEFMRDPLRMSPAAKAAAEAKHGKEKFTKMRLERIAELAPNIRVSVT